VSSVDGLRGILFDFGGTLDAAGRTWPDRFAHVYREIGVDVPADLLRTACGFATRSAFATPALAGVDLAGTIDFHVRFQLQSLALEDAAVAREVARRFLAESAAALADSRALLARWSERFALGVVSNFYGNLDRILADAGIAPYLTAVLDSTVVGVSKPEPSIFARALEQLGVAPGHVLFVGDSLTKDIAPARRAGMRTAWLCGSEQPPDPAVADVYLATLADLEPLLR
jgi:putative hydrolase of the HAD superfamily